MRIHPLLSLCFLALACQEEQVTRPAAWDEIAGKPQTFPTTWSEVAGKPTSYPTTWPEVLGAPTVFPTSWDEVAGKPLSFPTAWPDVAERPTTFPTTWDEVSGKPTSFPADWADLTGAPASFPTEWSQIANRPAAFPSDWSLVANRPATFPTDPVTVQVRVIGACTGGEAIAAVNEDGSVGCVPPARPVTAQLPATTWGVYQCASIASNTGLAGLATPSLRFDPTGACGTIRAATNVLAIPLELPPGPRPFRVRALMSALDFTGPVDLRLEWRVATAGSGVGSFSCSGSRSLTVPALASVQAMTNIEFDFTADPVCGEPGQPLVLSLTRTDAAANAAIVRNVHAVFE